MIQSIRHRKYSDTPGISQWGRLLVTPATFTELSKPLRGRRKQDGRAARRYACFKKRLAPKRG